jgi:hypothetical protein
MSTPPTLGKRRPPNFSMAAILISSASRPEQPPMRLSKGLLVGTLVVVDVDDIVQANVSALSNWFADGDADGDVL